MKQIVILGSTGSIGTQTLDVIAHAPADFSVLALAAYGRNLELLCEQIETFHPAYVCLYQEDALKSLKDMLGARDFSWEKITFLAGMDGLCVLASLPEADLVVTSLVGMIGILPTIKAIEAGNNIALANKETLACAGSYIMKLAADHHVKILPVDSEHGAIFQCLEGVRREDVDAVWLTASGGPFRGYSKEMLEQVTLEQALKHPNWSMGAKITIDSATLMNKGIEMIEAKYLYDLRPEQVIPIVHPQSLVHSMVELKDGAVIAQLGPVDMRLPIQVMLYYPERGNALMQKVDFRTIGSLTFEPIDEEVFPSIAMARYSMQREGLFPACFNAANEIAVEKFRKGQIRFTDIYRLVEKALSALDAEGATRKDYEIEEIIHMPERIRHMIGE
ncbi:MAG: 1-deoxy-D-xylulose-5-phosphate reductoisomerase [Firmicutes bacterium]|nr:1-deoxy-D-xylulose-5-phosphate reductoisomerase [Bacillota bacterium]